MLELARHPDIVEAIGRMRGGDAADAHGLLAMKVLAREQPNVWVTEVVHAFYAKPTLARAAWVELRYCRQFVRDIARRTLREIDVRSRPWSRMKSVALPIPDEILRHSRADRAEAGRMLAARLHQKPEEVDRLCEGLNELPPEPTFIRDIIQGQRLPYKERDAAIRELLAQPEKLRECVPEYRYSAGKRREAGRHPIPFAFVHESELQQIGQVRKKRGEDPRDLCSAPEQPETFRWHPARRAIEMQLCGLAFSGGGIRSATFNLGVLQTLAQNGLFKRIDYLSTVSGGGYIGSWLAAWIRREADDQQEHDRPDDPMSAIERRLSPTRSPNPMDQSVRPIRFLREYSNYLTPRAGFFSADTWTMIGIYVRNALLNQVTIVGLLVAVLLVPRGLHAACSWCDGHRGWALLIAALCWLSGIVILSLNLRRLDPPEAKSLVADETPVASGTAGAPRLHARPLGIQLFVAVPWVLASALSVRWLHSQTLLSAASIAGGLVGSSLLAVLAIGRADRCWRAHADHRSARFKAVAAISGSAAVAGLTAAGLTWVVYTVIAAIPAQSDALPWHLAALATPGLISAVSLGIVAMLGMLGAQFPDEHREWWSRFRTMLHVDALAWLAWFAAAVYVPWAVHAAGAAGFGTKSSLVTLAAWAGSTVFGIRKGPTADAKLKEQRESPAAPALSNTMLHYAALVAPYVFVVGLVLGVSVAIHEVIAHNVAGCAALRETPALWKSAYWTCAGTNADHAWLWAAITLGVALLFSWRVNINEFSIHHFYKNRLVRCYLGASRGRDRKPDWFTGFDPSDDIPLRAFDIKKTSPQYPGPYPIVNCALNLVRGRDLAWQERKATSFVFTPKYCGYDVDRAVLSKDQKLRSEGFVPTLEFYGDGGPTLGTAMSISGAAANPSMGRASSPALTFLMTVFNVRLGWWIGNPRTRHSALPGPRMGLLYTILELFGATDDSRSFVNLSDGGHFDNLGVYELVRRFCRFIVVCDAGQDGRFVFEDLGDLIRRCRTDFGVEIDIAVDRIRQRDELGRSQTHCVVGTIHYLNLPRRIDGRLVDKHDRPLLCDPSTGELLPGQMPGHEIGYLVYLKPTMTGDEPQDVLEYFRRIPEFPHQTTADQWFGESQFESYRKLGMHIANATFARYLHEDSRTELDLEKLFDQLYRYWYPPSLVINERATEHATEYSRIMETLRRTEALEALDRVAFAGLAVPDGKKASTRDEFYVCNRMIQLMENVYADLDLESNWDHPHVEGWMRVFKRWVNLPEFQRTWKISECTYADRFRNFYNERLKGHTPPLAPEEREGVEPEPMLTLRGG
jgi:predicted acylesterase/phospholipase RssA